jgi:hypothetical protein
VAQIYFCVPPVVKEEYTKPSRSAQSPAFFLTGKRIECVMDIWMQQNGKAQESNDQTVASLLENDSHLNEAREHLLSEGFPEAEVNALLCERIDPGAGLIKCLGTMNDHATTQKNQAKNFEVSVNQHLANSHPGLDGSARQGVAKALIQAGCFNHKRNLACKDAVAEENVLMKALRLDATAPPLPAPVNPPASSVDPAPPSTPPPAAASAPPTESPRCSTNCVDSRTPVRGAKPVHVGTS